MFHQRLLWLVIGAALLSSCGGGGATTSNPPAPSTPTPLARPDTVGTIAAYSGTLTENDVNNLIGATPVPSLTTSNVTTTIATSRDGAGNPLFTSTEKDTTPLETLTTTTVATVAYQTQPNGVTNVRALKTVANDSNGVVYETDYGNNNGLLAILPETNGTFSNDAQETYKETDPGINVGAGGTQNVTTERDVNADGSYTQTSVDKNATTGANVNDVATEKADFSGSLVLASIPGGRTFTFSAPSGGTISYQYANGSTNTTTTTTVPNWIPAIATPSVEKDTISTGATIDPSCKPAAQYGTTATKVIQEITIADAVLGTLETRTTTSYDNPGPGTICAVVADSISTFYDYSGQEGPAPRLFPSNSATVPAETVTIAETLSLQSTNAPSSSSSSRATASAGATGLILPRSLVLAHVEHLVHQQALRRIAALHATGGSSK